MTRGVAQPVLEIRDLAVAFRGGAPVVDGVSLSIHAGQTLAIVGESGSGKSVTALSALRLLPPGGQIRRGHILLRDGERAIDIACAGDRDLRRIRGGQVAMVFQEPMTSLNPVLPIGEQVAEAARLHQGVRGRAARDAAVRALEEVGVADAASRFGDYPHEFSGGMRQRVVIAIALACRPRVLLADEPTTALDAHLRMQILDLLDDARARRSMAVALITHDLGLVAERADALCVMDAGRVVEYGARDAVLHSPLHPYTRALLACAPRIDEARARLVTVRETLDAPGAFDPVPTGAGARTPWWPGGACRDGETCRLVDAGAERWLAVWAGAEVPFVVPDVSAARDEREAAA
ncbi:MAG: ATP-binding cassette domain-containing protein [Phycisphaerales bacterium]